jgi:hypothetical protein
MKGSQHLGDLRHVVQMRYDQKRQQFARLTAEETRLRTEIARLQAMLREARQDKAEARAMRAVGSDLLWQGWLGRSLSGLNQSLARVLAVKEYHKSEVRHAYGKLMAVDELAGAARRDRQKAQREGALEQAIEQSVLRRAAFFSR